MSEPSIPEIKRFHPLQGATFISETGSDILVEVTPDCARFSLRMHLEHLGKAAAAYGIAMPDEVGALRWEAEKGALCLGPDEWLLLAPQDSSGEVVSQFSTLARNTPHALVDVSDRTVGIELSGALARRSLSAGCPLDLENMAISRCTRTVLEKAQIVVIKLGVQHYRIEVLRSFAPYVWEFLQKAGQDSKY